MEKIIIDFNFSAPYYKLGSITEHTRKIWIVFHGYGQLAEDFSTSFNNLLSNDNFLIFPQGLSKFYLKGIGNKIGANWMTAHDRDLDITNYLTYLNEIFEAEIRPFIKNSALYILGFSQGGHTASRWIHHSKIPYSKLILWGTTLAHEIDKRMVQTSFSTGENLFVLGDEDKFIGQDNLRKIETRYSRIGFDYELVKYHGDHDIYPEILTKLN